jgi:hypothetical protein
MRHKLQQLHFGAPTLSRLYCRKCHEESIHKSGRCVHCKTLFLGYKLPERQKLKSWNGSISHGGTWIDHPVKDIER